MEGGGVVPGVVWAVAVGVGVATPCWPGAGALADVSAGEEDFCDPSAEIVPAVPGFGDGRVWGAGVEADVASPSSIIWPNSGLASRRRRTAWAAANGLAVLASGRAAVDDIAGAPRNRRARPR